LGSESHADADFAGAAGGGVGEGSVESDGRDQQGAGGEEDGKDGHDSFGSEGGIHDFAQRCDVGSWNCWGETGGDGAGSGGDRSERRIGWIEADDGAEGGLFTLVLLHGDVGCGGRGFAHVSVFGVGYDSYYFVGLLGSRIDYLVAERIAVGK